MCAPYRGRGRGAGYPPLALIVSFCVAMCTPWPVRLCIMRQTKRNPTDKGAVCGAWGRRESLSRVFYFLFGCSLLYCVVLIAGGEIDAE